MIKIQKFKIVLVVCILSLVVTPVFAAETFFESENPQIRVGDKFEVGFFLNTENQDINAIEGKVAFPESLLELKEIGDGNSIINFWIERPQVVNGEVSFSGIIPGGYFDKRGLIFSLVFQSVREGRGSIETRDIKTLRNDGKGTEAPLIISNFQFLISQQIPVTQITTTKTEDRNLPEKFTPQIAADPTLFKSKWFLVFATQDKGSGIDHYEVCEGTRKCVTTESPYLLQNQDLDEEITVKAVDKSGNERIATLPPQKSRAWYKNYLLPVILIIAIALAYLIWKTLWKKRKK